MSIGGHIGYCVRPAHRGQRYATEILRQGLIVARAEGIDRVLVTCDEDNVASARVIERSGGILEDIRADRDGPAKRRYWID
jgi:predicted acetyltransferase